MIIMLTAKVFQSGNSQAIRIPKEVQTDQKEFNISRVGNCFILFPVDDPWYPLRLTMGTFPQDFMDDRDQPLCSELPEREAF
jgi:antitoxin VapB